MSDPIDYTNHVKQIEHDQHVEQVKFDQLDRMSFNFKMARVHQLLLPFFDLSTIKNQIDSFGLYEKAEFKHLRLSKIKIPPYRNYEYVKIFKEKILNNEIIDPIIVELSIDHIYTVVEGVHRINAAKELNIKLIPAIVKFFVKVKEKNILNM